MSMHVTVKQCVVGVVVVAALLAVFLALPRPAGAEHAISKNVVAIEAPGELQLGKAIIPTRKQTGFMLCKPHFGEPKAKSIDFIPRITIVLGMGKLSRQLIFWNFIPSGGRHVIVDSLGTCIVNGNGHGSIIFNIYEVN